MLRSVLQVHLMESVFMLGYGQDGCILNFNTIIKK